MITRSAILQITTEEQMFSEFEGFESAIEITIEPLRKRLETSVMGQSNAQLMAHMVYVEAWRDKVGRFFSLTYMFVEHCKSSIFSPVRSESGKITQADREAYQKRLSAGFTSVLKDLETLIDSIDSRVNVCKKLMDFEIRGLNPRI